MFLKHGKEDKLAVFIVYVDDIILTGNDIDEIERLKMLLTKEFETKDLGSLKYFLGIEVARSRKGIFCHKGNTFWISWKKLGCWDANLAMFL